VILVLSRAVPGLTMLMLGAAIARAESFTFSTAAGLAGSSPVLGMSGDGSNNLARFTSPAGVCLDSANAIYITDGHLVRRMTALGTNWVVTTLAGLPGNSGSSDGTNSGARFDQPEGIALDASGNLFVADTINNAVRKVSPVGTNWVVTTIAGMAGSVYSGSADGTNNSARFNHPYGIATDPSGNLFVADTYNSTIRKITPAGTNWVVSTLAGSASYSGSADGTNGSARFNGPTSLTIDNATNIYVADFNNHTIRKAVLIGTNCVVGTIAGYAGASGGADGTNSSARFYFPQALCEDSFGNLYVSDAGNNTIRKLKPAGTNWVVTTVAGLAGASGSADGTGSAALFSDPFGLAMDPLGRLFVADSMNKTMRLGRAAILLDMSLSSSQLRLSWPIAATNYALEMNSNISGGGSWNAIISGITASGDTYVFNTNATAARAFFRLHKP